MRGVRLAVLAVAAAGCGGPVVTRFPDAGKSAAELRALLADPDPAVKARGAFGLSRLGADARDAVPDLVPLLAAPDPLVRQNAALALGSVGPDAKAAVGPLTDALKDAEWAVRRQAAVSLGRIGPDARAAAELGKLARDPHKVVRDAARDARRTKRDG